MGAILLADLEELPLAVKAAHLVECGFDVMTAADVVELTSRFREDGGRFGLLVAEVDLMRQLRPSSIWWWFHDVMPGTKLVITSDFPPNPFQDQDRVLDVLSDGFLLRPFSLDELAEQVDRVLRRS